MLTVYILCYILNIMPIARFAYAHLAPCISVYFIECLVELIDKDYTEITLQLEAQVQEARSGKERKDIHMWFYFIP